MSRRIDTGEAPKPQDGNHPALMLGGEPGGDGYTGRLAGYIPAEIVGLYIAASSIVPSDSKAMRDCVLLWFIFAATCAMVPVYFFFATSRDKEKKGPLLPQILLASCAFPVWAFALGGPFKCTFVWYDNRVASAALMFVTFAFGLYRPRQGS